ncbi:hypothetical protein C3B55_00155 [Candidatus Pseudomonas adelgestsugas]|uniref:Uncharacterized protein n=1 Tax=Candidatus Pseudomonas adelgestsugas TaxID=1302376 RepID=A0ABX5R795_9PSED|nr:hypothetical protein C3B55_00155 [Candidatus Pseudomonas adelgestsugas]
MVLGESIAVWRPVWLAPIRLILLRFLFHNRFADVILSIYTMPTTQLYLVISYLFIIKCAPLDIITCLLSGVLWCFHFRFKDLAVSHL